MFAKDLAGVETRGGRRVPRRILLLAGALALLASAGAVAAGAAITGSNERIDAVSATQNAQPTASASEPASASYLTNTAGETYGSSASALAPQEEPDLIQAIGKNSSGEFVEGYVRRSELHAATGAGIQTPAEAPIYARARASRGATMIPLYAEDGSTIIGNFTIPAPSPPPTSANR